MLQLWDINLFDSVHLIIFYFLNGKVIKFIKINIWKKEFKQSMSSCSIFFSNLIFLTFTLIKIKYDLIHYVTVENDTCTVFKLNINFLLF